ncbi:Abhydrolase domain-containing protein 2-A [Trichostrongylus colubriformis]|uniref:Abhydrolase domain-containing protein 2-A n=1 Tax=Trichostrongylus colubriformis TaxID=6319 RepID=A0AAN8F2T7_TRICO
MWSMMSWLDVVSNPLEYCSLSSPELPSSSMMLWIVVSAIIIRFLHIFGSSAAPEVTMLEKSEHTTMKNLINGIDMLREPYRPPSLWGRSGHVQTVTYGLLGHAQLKRVFDRRAAVRLADGSTVTFDVFEPINKHESGLDLTLALTPGIANCSESNYIRTCVHYAQERGYRCAVLNHLGALHNVKLTGNRIFTYGGTEELHAMMNQLFSDYPRSHFINIGFSMGANITSRFLAQVSNEQRNRILLGLSVCQGYSATTSAPMYHDWENGRRIYNYFITENMKRLLRRNYEQAVAPHVASGLIDEQRLWSATSIVAFDENYNRRVAGFQNLEAFYAWCDSLPLLPSIKVPMIFLNAEDDPIVPRCLWEPVKELASRSEDMAFISTRYGGHLGFLEGGSFSPHSVTWLDRFIVVMADQAVKAYAL